MITESAPAVASNGSFLWIWSFKTPSSNFLCADVVRVVHSVRFHISHDLMTPSWLPEYKYRPEGSKHIVDIAELWAYLIKCVVLLVERSKILICLFSEPVATIKSILGLHWRVLICCCRKVRSGSVDMLSTFAKLPVFISLKVI